LTARLDYGLFPHLLGNLPDPDILANDIIENIESGLNTFKKKMLDLKKQHVTFLISRC